MILRLTVHSNAPPDPDDLAVDANMVYMVITDTSKSEPKTRIAILYLRCGGYITVADPNRDIMDRWIRATGEMEELPC